ncbi:hypothetical protein PV733_07270 [Streptomyces europaeiscabiei]|uniref:hypothetical protein n=1 Tax=Streptomyces europaeiscabiei TaxID=146819 RepID=UPI0029AF0792|nr:hypothetical protein [Streptomyces europaeiscabiei]MDX3708774.1 hypothetical protein [Streptomyces europaeiscabiei]
MRTTTTAAAVIACAALLAGCADDGPAPAELARQACGTIGADNEHLTPDPDSQGADVQEAQQAADEATERADLAAAAAVRDPRWTRLADAFTWLAAELDDSVARAEIAGGLSVTDQPEEYRQNLATLEADCRKAHAAP